MGAQERVPPLRALAHGLVVVDVAFTLLKMFERSERFIWLATCSANWTQERGTEE